MCKEKTRKSDTNNFHMVCFKFCTCFKNESQETHQTTSRYLRLGGLVHHHHLRHHRGSGANSAKLCRAATGGGAAGLGALSQPVTDRRWIHTDGIVECTAIQWAIVGINYAIFHQSFNHGSSSFSLNFPCISSRKLHVWGMFFGHFAAFGPWITR